MGIDHLGPFTTTMRGNRHLLVLVENFSRHVWVYPALGTTASEALNLVLAWIDEAPV